MDPLQNFTDTPLVTVQVAMHNGDVHLAERALRSLVGQLPTGQLQVVIAFDGEPTPENEHKLAEVCASLPFPVHFFGEATGKATGYYTTPRNRTFPMCWSFYVAHLDADNEFLPGHLEGLLRAIRVPDAKEGWPHFVYSRREYVRDEGAPENVPLGPSPLTPWTPENVHWLLVDERTPKRNFLDTGDFLIGRSALYELAERSGCVWNSNLTRFGDWDLVCRMAAAGFRGKAVDQVTSRYHWHSNNLQLTRPVSDINFVPASVYQALRDQGLIRD